MAFPGQARTTSGPCPGAGQGRATPRRRRGVAGSEVLGLGALGPAPPQLSDEVGERGQRREHEAEQDAGGVAGAVVRRGRDERGPRTCVPGPVRRAAVGPGALSDDLQSPSGRPQGAVQVPAGIVRACRPSRSGSSPQDKTRRGWIWMTSRLSHV